MQGRLELIKPQNLTNTRQYGKTLRVEFTLTKLQEDLPEQESSRQITRAHKILTKATRTKHFQFQTKISQANQHAKALQKSSKLKKKKQVQAVGCTANISSKFGQLLLSPEG